MNCKNDEFFLELAAKAAERATCLKRHVGAVIVKNDSILSIGINGAPENLGACESCYRLDNNIPSGQMLDHCYAVHAEPYAIIEALKKGHDLKDSTIYITTSPCIHCAKLLIHCGIKRIVVSEIYNDKFSLDTLKKANIDLILIDNITYGNENLDIIIDEFLKHEHPTLTKNK